MNEWLIWKLYYRYSYVLSTIIPYITIQNLKIKTFPEVSKPIHEEFRMVEYCVPGANVLDLGSGTGIIGIFASLRGASVTSVDISPRALENTIYNQKRFGLEQNIDTIYSDMFSNVKKRYDLILTHPPYIEVEIPGSNDNMHWVHSTKFMPRLLNEADQYLNPNGKLLIVWPVYNISKVKKYIENTKLELESIIPIKRKKLNIALQRWLYLELFQYPQIFIIKKKSKPNININ